MDVTSATGYSTLGAPTGRHIAPAGGNGCLQGFTGQCGFSRLVLEMMLLVAPFTCHAGLVIVRVVDQAGKGIPGVKLQVSPGGAVLYQGPKCQKL